MELTPTAINNYFQRLNFQFQNQYTQVPTMWRQIATEFPSDSEGNIYPFLSMIPGLREWLGPRVIKNVAARSYNVVNKHFESTQAIDLNKFRDDTYGFYSALQPMMAIQVAEFIDRRLATIVEAGTTSICWDGQFFFDVDHPVDPDNSGAGTNSNKLVGANYDISGNSGNPLIAYQNVKQAMATWKREDGSQIGIIPDLIMVHPQDETYARQICNASLTAQAIGSNAGAGVTNVFNGTISYIVNPFLTVTTGHPWYLLCTKRGVKPFGWQNRQAPNLVARSDVSLDNIFKLRQIEWGVDLRGEALYTFPFLAFRGSAS